uniref:Triosephosphate isomerase n=1 Tax=Candidatus Aschnera chinzeii TaxID=1485666 RepID=A0AAT9G501_9ENTR|nr:MAG: triose-phosphate isomerase [Candidatus Aschnera chinzeii]
MRYPLVVANWKLNGNIKFIKTFLNNLSINIDKFVHCNIVIAPPCMYLYEVNKLLKNNKLFLGAQNSDIYMYGAYTGDISLLMLKDVGVRYVIIGHSERRLFHHETNEIIAKKFFAVKQNGLIPILCIGENEKEYNNCQTEIVCKQQIDIILQKINIDAFRDTVIAYEPVWAIGTGKTPTPKRVQLIHKCIRDYLATYDFDIANKVIIQYGGSISSKNVYDFSIQPDIDGVLVGNASLDINEFIAIINNVIASKKLI